MKIEEKRLDEIQPYENNPRRNDGGAVEAVAASIKEFGFRVPILIDKTGTVIAGHTRLKAAEQLGLEKVPCIIVDGLDDEEIRQLRIVDNKTQELAKWDFGLLADELEKIKDIDMDAFGFAAFDAENEEPERITSSLDEGEEVDLDDFEDEAFAHKCPRCGYVWS